MAPALVASAFLRGHRKLRRSGPRPNTPARPMLAPKHREDLARQSETRPGRAIPADRSDGDAKCGLGLNASAQFASASSQTRMKRQGARELLANVPIVGSVYGNKPRGSLRVLYNLFCRAGSSRCFFWLSSTPMLELEEPKGPKGRKEGNYNLKDRKESFKGPWLLLSSFCNGRSFHTLGLMLEKKQSPPAG